MVVHSANISREHPSCALKMSRLRGGVDGGARTASVSRDVLRYGRPQLVYDVWEDRRKRSREFVLDEIYVIRSCVEFVSENPRDLDDLG